MSPATKATNATSDDEWTLEPKSHATATAFSIPSPRNYVPPNADLGYQAALLRSLRSAGVKYIRYTVVDAFNTIRCKAVPIEHALRRLPSRTGRKTVGSKKPAALPLDNPVSIAEVCFAGLPPHADVPVPAARLDGRNVLALHPDFASLRVLPYAKSTANVMCTAHDQRTGELSPYCTRGLLQRVLKESRETLGVEFCVGAELEFQLFHDEILKEGQAPRPVDGSTFANAVTLNEQEDFVSALYDQLGEQDVAVELVHGESAPGQLEVVLGYSSDVVQLADDVVMARETITALAKKFQMKALFLPKTSMMTAGSGLHLHFSFRDVDSSSGDNAFSDPNAENGISARGGTFLEGILSHLPSLLSLSAPTDNSFRRIGPGCWTGSSVGWSAEDKESGLRVCVDLDTREATNVELKLSDATANVYLELATVLAAGMDGLEKGKALRPALSDEMSEAEPLPGSLKDSLDALKKNEFLLNVMGPELGTAYIAVRESLAESGATLEEEVRDAFARA